MPEPAITLYTTPLSGHGHRVVLLLRMLDLPHAIVAAPAERRQTPEFLALNPLGQIPVLRDAGLVPEDSNAILVYLATSYDAACRRLSSDPAGVAAVQHWLSITAGKVPYGPAICRAIAQWNAPGDRAHSAAIATRLLRFMQAHLETRELRAAPHPTIADLACYSYIAHAPEGGIGLQPDPAVRAWPARVEALPGFVPMPRSPLPSEA